MWLLTSVRPDVSGLVFQAVESLIAERALVRPGQFARVLCGLTTWQRAVGPNNGNCSHVHVSFVIDQSPVCLCWRRRCRRGGLGIQQVGKIHR